jgi:hypothetical protein
LFAQSGPATCQTSDPRLDNRHHPIKNPLDCRGTLTMKTDEEVTLAELLRMVRKIDRQTQDLDKAVKHIKRVVDKIHREARDPG